MEVQIIDWYFPQLNCPRFTYDFRNVMEISEDFEPAQCHQIRQPPVCHFPACQRLWKWDRSAVASHRSMIHFRLVGTHRRNSQITEQDAHRERMRQAQLMFTQTPLRLLQFPLLARR